MQMNRNPFHFSIVGYYSKYDNSSGDISPLGSLSKNDVRNVVMQFLKDRPEFKYSLSR